MDGARGVPRGAPGVQLRPTSSLYHGHKRRRLRKPVELQLHPAHDRPGSAGFFCLLSALEHAACISHAVPSALTFKSLSAF